MGRPARLIWYKQRFRRPNTVCSASSFTEEDVRIAASRLVMSDRAARWVTLQLGWSGRSISEVARELGCDWHTVNNAVIAYGEALVEHPSRFSSVEALGLDETLMAKIGPFRRQQFSTQIVDVGAGQLLDVVEGRGAEEPIKWLTAKGDAWIKDIRHATLDMSGAYRSVFDKMTPDAIQIADPFHVVKHANTKLDEYRRSTASWATGRL